MVISWYFVVFPIFTRFIRFHLKVQVISAIDLCNLSVGGSEEEAEGGTRDRTENRGRSGRNWRIFLEFSKQVCQKLMTAIPMKYFGQMARDAKFCSRRFCALQNWRSPLLLHLETNGKVNKTESPNLRWTSKFRHDFWPSYPVLLCPQEYDKTTMAETEVCWDARPHQNSCQFPL